MASASKIASVCLLARLLYDPFYGIHNQWQQVIIVIAIVSMFIGSFGALMQTNLKRLLAYSSIGHVGFILAGLACTEEAGVPGVLIYLTIYLTQTIVAFASVIFLRIGDNSIVNIDDLKGLHKAHPFMAFILAVTMFSMAGIPPLAGFFAKLFILQPLIASKLYATALLFVIASVIACFYYLRIVKIMYFDAPEQEVVYAKARGVGVLLLLYTAFNLFFILAPTALLTITQAAFEAFGSAL
jgi:NADH-quinone oxidoreductase subunit N